ncbi:hypothetical protein [Lacunimicrobium album]
MALTFELLEHISHTVDENGNNGYQSVYRVWSDTPNPHPRDVTECLGITRNVSTFPYDSSSVATTFSTTSAGGQGETLGTVFNVTVSYAPLVLTAAANVDGTPTRRYRKEPIVRTYSRDAQGVFVCNSAGVPPGELFTREESIDILQITRNESSYTSGGMTNCVNSNSFEGYPPGTVYCSSPEADRIYDSAFAGGGYWRVSYEFRIDVANGWDVKFADMGTSEKKLKTKENESDPDEYELVPITDEAGNPVGEAVLLNGNGERLEPGQPTVWRTVQPYRRAPFNFGFV